MNSTFSIGINTVIDAEVGKALNNKAISSKNKAAKKGTSASKSKLSALVPSTKDVVSTITHKGVEYYIDNSTVENKYQCPITPPTKQTTNDTPKYSTSIPGYYTPFRPNSNVPAFANGTSFVPLSFK